MASVSVLINGKNYRMACEEGQEAHLISLAERLDGYVGQLKGSFGEIGDQRLTVMAGVMVTDELFEMEKKNAALTAEIEKLQSSAQSTVSEMGSVEQETAQKIAAIAERLSELAGRLTVKPAAKK
ncbi:MAG: cell division protein ZapA [Salaquimonas sp.]